MFYMDSHIHLQDYKTQDIKNVVTNAVDNGINVFINASAHPDDWNKIQQIAAEYTQVIPAFGIHPWYFQNAQDNQLAILEEFLQKNPKAWVGECGIDRLKNRDIAKQSAIFLEQAQLANKYNRPLIVHAVKADEVLYPLLNKLPQQTIFHSFCGSSEWGKILQNKGFYLGINFAILRKKNADTLLKSLNLRQILLETDGPYQNIIQHIETLPEDIPLLAHKIADLLNMEYGMFAEIIYQNQQQFMGDR